MEKVELHDKFGRNLHGPHKLLTLLTLGQKHNPCGALANHFHRPLTMGSFARSTKGHTTATTAPPLGQLPTSAQNWKNTNWAIQI